jgi:hypothetical protein
MLKLIYNSIGVICIVYAVFRPMDVLSWWWVKAKAVVLGIWNLIKGLRK